MSAVIETLRRVFSRSSKKSESPSLPDTPDNREAEGEAALETLASTLSTWGRHGFDLDASSAEELGAHWERWSRHVALGSPAPAQDGGEGRQWSALRRFVAQHRQSEKSYVARSFGDLREALWSVVRNLASSVASGQSADGEFGVQITRLRSSVEHGSTDQIKRDVLEIADHLSSVLARRAEEQESVVRQLSEQMRSLREELDSARRHLETDPLTKLYNRGAFDEQLMRVAALSTLSGQPACLAMIDVDHFKVVNDTHGHPCGDEVLRKLADAVVASLPRRSDFVARYGGEEFAAILQQDSAEVAEPLLDRLLRKVRTMLVEYEGQEIRVTVSIGLAELRRGESAENWLKRADYALYSAKQDGRDRLVLAQRSLQTR